MDLITIKGDRNLWLEFTMRVKKKKKRVWDILGPMLEEYIKNAN